MYINFWYPMVRSEDLSPDKPEKVKVLGLNFAVFRDSEGVARTLSDTCTHRGGSLSGPWELPTQPRIVNGCVVCPYHGWEFGGDGECKNSYGTKPPARAKVDSYPTVEKYGIVFAFLGDLPENERPPMIDVKEWGQPEWRANSVLVLDVPYYYERSIENGIDPAHNEFVHPTHGHSAINRETYKVREHDVVEGDQKLGIVFRHRYAAPGLKHETWKGVDAPAADIYAGTETFGPNAMITQIEVAPGKMFRQYFIEQPVDDNRTRIFFVNMRNFLLDAKNDGPIHARNKVIAQQDIEILSEVYPLRTPISSTKEVHMPADKAVVGYREWLAKFDDNGWRIDWNEFKARNGKGDIAFAIPCPGRRTSGNWVLEPVPMLKNREARKAAKAS
ncbi:MAG: aromatic ring-hydroxylating dioxygenase subunit alpha [Gammaproteobacteria bacterium PRO8]|nr:aromatic ring-hydroxylating dioxygenase subunit alpha [Gammaproteobacteria bacterium PRO8]